MGRIKIDKSYLNKPKINHTYIYKLYNKNFIYIGITKNPPLERYIQHRKKAYTFKNTLLYINAFLAGFDLLKFKVLEEVNNNIVKIREKELIKVYVEKGKKMCLNYIHNKLAK